MLLNAPRGIVNQSVHTVGLSVYLFTATICRHASGQWSSESFLLIREPNAVLPPHSVRPLSACSFHLLLSPHLSSSMFVACMSLKFTCCVQLKTYGQWAVATHQMSFHSERVF